MYNDKTRKLTSLTLMTIMLAGGMSFAVPGMEPAFAADGELSVSAQEVGNFAGIQVIEIVVDDPDRSDTSESQGIPNVELNGDDVLMAQGDDGAWYAYVANEQFIEDFETDGGDVTDFYNEDSISTTPFSGSDAISSYLNTEVFLDGFKDLSATSSTGSVTATGTVVLADVQSADTITINSLEYTAVAGTAADNTEFSIDGDNDADAIALAAAVNSRDSTTFVATTSTDTVTLTAVAIGILGNDIAIATTDATFTSFDALTAGGIDNVFAFGTITLVSVADLDTVTINGLVYTAEDDGAALAEGEFATESTPGADDTSDATNLATAISIDTRTGTTGAFTAATSTNVVTVTTDVAGTAGNAITLVSSSGSTLAVTGSGFFTGGIDVVQATADITLATVASADTATINGLEYFAITGTAADNTEFSIDGTDIADASALSTAINSRDSSVSAATASTSTVTVSAAVSGASGNAITLAEFGTTITVSGSTLTGGVTGDTSLDNNPALEDTDWPFIQTYNISDNSVVTITYGTGSTAEDIEITYDYDDDKDVSLDRQRYPVNSYVFLTLDDSLLNLSPTAEDIWTFDATDGSVDYVNEDLTINVQGVDTELIGFEEGPLTFSTADGVYELSTTGIHPTLFEDAADANVLILRESNDNDNVFVNYDRSDISNLLVVGAGESSIAYNDAHSVILDTFNGKIEFDGPAIEEWLSGIELALILTDEDRNLNSLTDETISILDDEVPYISIETPLHLDSSTVTPTGQATFDADGTDSKIFDMSVDASSTDIVITVDWPYVTSVNNEFVFSYANFDFTELGGDSGTFYLGSPDGLVAEDSGITVVNDDADTFSITFSGLTASASGQVYFDVLSFGQLEDITDGSTDDNSDLIGDITENVDRVNDGFYRFELEETDDNTAQFEGTVEYIMINQLNVFDEGTYDNISTTGDDIVIIVNDDMDGVDAITVSYLDIDSTSSEEIISVQEDANTHTGTIELDDTGYSSGNTITVTLTDADLNTDSDTIQTYSVETGPDWVGDDTVWLAQLLVNDEVYDDDCGLGLGLDDTGFSFIETSKQSGIFVGSFKLPALYCDTTTTLTGATTNGLDLDFEYQDYSDSSGNSNEGSTAASIRSNTGSVELDRHVFPVPFTATEFLTYGSTTDYLPAGDVIVTISVNDPDFNTSASGEDTLPISTLTLTLSRGSNDVDIPLTDLDDLLEVDPKSGIFEIEVTIPQELYTDLGGSGTDDLINQGDILVVEYTDPNDASGESNSVTDSATFDLRNAVLQTDKSVYIIGSDAIITLIEPDLNLDSDSAETWSLDLVNWDSDAGDINLSDDIFDASTSGFRETGDNTGIFQVVIEIPKEIDDDKLERGEQITLEYEDNGPAGADFIGDDQEDINLDIYTSNFGATITLDQKVYTWTDKVYVTVVAPDHNFDSDSIDEIGNDADTELSVSTREDELPLYKLVETGTDTGIFTGEIILTGFANHDADGDGDTSDVSGNTEGNGPTGGFLSAGDDDGLTVSFEMSDGEVVTGSALVRWNIGEVQWLQSSYPASGTGVMRVIDPDMNLNPESVDSFDVNVWSDTAAGGISLSVTETNEATGIFEGTVFFTTTDGSSGSRLAVSEGDTITAEYEDNTLPDPYSTADELDITATAIIGTNVPPLERAPAANLRTVDAFGNSLSAVTVDQQVQIEAELSNGQDREQTFAYLVQIQNSDGVTVKLDWITGQLNAGQNFTPAVSWIPEGLGTYTATVFVWESVDNPTALSPPITIDIPVN